MKIIDPFIISAILIFLSFYMIGRSSEKKKISKQDSGQKYVYKISLKDTCLTGYSDYKISRPEDAIYYCEFIKVADGKRAKNASLSDIIISKEELKNIKLQIIERDKL